MLIACPPWPGERARAWPRTRPCSAGRSAARSCAARERPAVRVPAAGDPRGAGCSVASREVHLRIVPAEPVHQVRDVVVLDHERAAEPGGVGRDQLLQERAGLGSRGPHQVELGAIERDGVLHDFSSSRSTWMPPQLLPLLSERRAQARRPMFASSTRLWIAWSNATTLDRTWRSSPCRSCTKASLARSSVITSFTSDLLPAARAHRDGHRAAAARAGELPLGEHPLVDRDAVAVVAALGRAGGGAVQAQLDSVAR